MAWNYVLAWFVTLPLEIVAASITLSSREGARSINPASSITVFVFVIVSINLFDLTGPFLDVDKPEQMDAYNLTMTSSTTASTSSTATSISLTTTSAKSTSTSSVDTLKSSTIASTTASSTKGLEPTASVAATQQSQDHKSNTAAIAGGVAGGAAGLAFLVGILIYFALRNKKSRDAHQARFENQQVNRMSGHPGTGNSPFMQAPPPTFSNSDTKAVHSPDSYVHHHTAPAGDASVELPGDSSVSPQSTWNSPTAHHNRYSELSADTVVKPTPSTAFVSPTMSDGSSPKLEWRTHPWQQQ
ncbi:hypothetical protein CC80DRAFT_546016 [Byssothecium circinans]|uniref:Mid2 domain-containing protein n=1 Tax=Byssothecium circinans TaxID=147558 RepID=A0A6A5U4B6_9PLEO|nr:hypothetical protein CC80DRAFT_546016 [Byssothecium circinans]